MVKVSGSSLHHQHRKVLSEKPKEQPLVFCHLLRAIGIN